MATIHANGPVEALHRLETLVLLADVGLPLGAVRQQVSAAVDVVVHVERRGSTRTVVAVAEVAGTVASRQPVRLLADGVRVLAAPIRPPRLVEAAP